jgi:hypothetical protein
LQRVGLGLRSGANSLYALASAAVSGRECPSWEVMPHRADGNCGIVRRTQLPAGSSGICSRSGA